MWSKDNQNLLGILEAIERIEEYISPFNSADEFFESICYSLRKRLKRF